MENTMNELNKYVVEKASFERLTIRTIILGLTYIHTYRYCVCGDGVSGCSRRTCVVGRTHNKQNFNGISILLKYELTLCVCLSVGCPCAQIM